MNLDLDIDFFFVIYLDVVILTSFKNFYYRNEGYVSEGGSTLLVLQITVFFQDIITF